MRINTSQKVLTFPIPTFVFKSPLAINVRCYFKPSVKRNERCWHFHLTLTYCNIFLAINDRFYFKPSVKRIEKCWHFHLYQSRCHVLAYTGGKTVFDTNVSFFPKTIDSLVSIKCNKQVSTKSNFLVVKGTLSAGANAH